MLFHSFNSQEERRKCGGSDFIEIQHCSLNKNTPLKDIVSNDFISSWKDDSLYIYCNDMNIFYNIYENIITGGTYSNFESGCMDLYGINYYSPEKTSLIIENLTDEKPAEYKVLLKWLENSKNSNGFYIFGV